MFKTPYLVSPIRPERKNKERQLKIENQKLKELQNKEADEAADREKKDADKIQKDAEKMKKDAEILEEHTATIEDLKFRLADHESKMKERDHEIALLQGASGGPQEETWRVHVKVNDTQTLQLENNYQ